METRHQFVPHTHLVWAASVLAATSLLSQMFVARAASCIDDSSQSCEPDPPGCTSERGYPYPGVGECVSKGSRCCGKVPLCVDLCYGGSSCPVGTDTATGKCSDGKVCCKTKEAAPAPITTRALCTASGGTCATGSGCDGNAPKFESADGTCEGGVSCCKKSTLLEGAAKREAERPSPTSLVDPLGGAGVSDVIGRIVKTFIGITGAGALLVFVYAGVIYMTASGREDQITKAIETMKYAFIGLIIILFAYVITNTFLGALAG